MRPLLLLLAVSTLSAGCVGKKKYDVALAELATLDDQLASVQATADQRGARMLELDAALEQARARGQELDAMATQLEANNAALQKRLQELTANLSEMSARSAREREAKSELEKALGALEQDAASAQASAQETRARMAEIQAQMAQMEREKAALERKTAAYDQLVDSLQTEIAAGTVKITELSGKLTVNLSNAILFDSGRFEVKGAGRDALTKVAGVLAQVADREVRVEGHTDNVPVNKGAGYADNWALSSLRASAVVSLLVGAGVDPDNIAAVGYGDRRPVASNDTDEGRAANRRTEIVLVPRLDRLTAEGAAATP